MSVRHFDLQPILFCENCFCFFLIIFQTLLSPFRSALSPEPLASIKEDHRKHVQTAYYTLFRLSEYFPLFYKIYINLIQNRLNKEEDTTSDKAVCVFALGEVRQRAALISTNTIFSIMLNIPGWYDGLGDVSFQALFCEECYCLCSLRLLYIHSTAATTAPRRASNSVLMLHFSFCPPLQNWLKWYMRTPSYVPKESNWDVISALVWTFFLFLLDWKGEKLSRLPAESHRAARSLTLMHFQAVHVCVWFYLSGAALTVMGWFWFYLWIGRETFIVSSLRF